MSECIFSVVYCHWTTQRAQMLTPAAVGPKEEQSSPCLDSPPVCKPSGWSMKVWTKFSKPRQIPWGPKTVFIWEGRGFCHLPLAPSHVWWAKTGGLLGWKTPEDSLVCWTHWHERFTEWYSSPCAWTSPVQYNGVLCCWRSCSLGETLHS